MTTDDNDDLESVDRVALERALALTMADEDDDRVEQVRSMLADPEWFEVASFCAYCQQNNALHLKPWQSPPCHIDADEIDAILARGPPSPQNMEADKEYGGALLLRRMLAAGLSAYDPTPLESLAAAKWKARA